MFCLFSYSKENEILVEAAAEMDRVDVLSQKSMFSLSLSPQLKPSILITILRTFS